MIRLAVAAATAARQHPCAEFRRNRLQGGDEVCQKACGVAIAFVQRQPCRGACAGDKPLADQRCLAKARRGRDERQFSVQAPVHLLDHQAA